MQIVTVSATLNADGKPVVSWQINFPDGYTSCHNLDCLRWLNGTLIDTLAPGFVDPNFAAGNQPLGFGVTRTQVMFTDDFSTWPRGEQAVPLPGPGDIIEYGLTGDLSDGTPIASIPYRVGVTIPSSAAITANKSAAKGNSNKKK